MKHWKNISKDGKIDPFPYSVMLAFADTKSLLRHTKLMALKNEIVDWLNENIGYDRWIFHLVGIIGFKSEEDAMGFILRWS